MIDTFVQAIRAAQADPEQIRLLAGIGRQIESIEDEQAEELLAILADMADELVTDPNLHQVLQPVASSLVKRAQAKGTILTPNGLGRVIKLYKQTPSFSNLRNYLLALLATNHHDECLQTWTELICASPPEHRAGIGLAFSPLMNHEFQPEEWMLEILLNEGVQHLQLAPAIFDVFNYYVREEIVTEHPAAERADILTGLLGQLVGQLGKIEEGSISPDSDPRIISQQVADSVALIVSLCDTMAILDYEPAIGKLHQALELRHRRVQSEAAAALIRLGDEAGKEALIKLAEEPVVRLRVLKYAEELDLLSDISLEYQGEIAQAESHLAMWLAEPAQMGIAPSNIELVDNREMYWPSYEHPIQCYLFQFEYGSGDQRFSNLAICGPLVHAFNADLMHLPVEDVYALFAGWQTVHDEIFQMNCDKAQSIFPNDWRRLTDDIAVDPDYTDVEHLLVGSFFGKLALVSRCKFEGEPGTAIIDADQISFVAEASTNAPIDPSLAYSIWQGRQLLSTFNPNSVDSTNP